MRNFNKDNSQLCTKCMFEQHRVICKSHLFYIIRNRPLVTKVFNLSFSNSISVEAQRRIANSPYQSFQSLFDYDDYLGNFVTMLFLVTCLMAMALMYLFCSIFNLFGIDLIGCHFEISMDLVLGQSALS